MLDIRGTVKLEFEGKEPIIVHNRVNFNFLLAPVNLIDQQKLSGTYVSNGLRNVDSILFTLMGNPVDTSMYGVYDRLAYITQSNFTTILATPLKTVIRGAGQVTANGTVKSGGFNVVCKDGIISGNSPRLNIPMRKVGVRVVGLASVPFTDNWVYIKELGALFRYASNSTYVYKLDYDMETNTIGDTVEELTDSFTGTTSVYVLTDGVSKIMKFNSGRTTMYVCDLETGDVTSHTPSSSLTWAGANLSNWGWDENHGGWISNDGSIATENFIVKPDGTVSKISRPSGSNFTAPRVVKEFYRIENNVFRSKYGTDEMAWISADSNGLRIEDLSPKSYRFPDENGWIVRASFDASTTPSTLTLDMVKEPETAMSLLTIPDTAVEVDMPFTIEYTFEVIDNR